MACTLPSIGPAPRCALVLLSILPGLAEHATAQPAPEVARALADDLRVPLHTGPADPVGGAYGLWAQGSGYKASFHDGFCFYPYRGADRPAVALRWRTESVRRGARELCDGAPAATTGAWRHELRYRTVSEVYDVRADGVEQSFVLHEAPAGSGDLVVIGSITTELRATRAEEAVQDLTFCADGQPVVRYGAALAFDGAGRRTDVTTEWDGERVVLRLDGAFLAGAAYPVTIDPLTSAVRIASTNLFGPVQRTAVAADNTASGRAMVVLTRQWSSGDCDAYGLLCDKDFRNPVTVWSDVQTVWSTRELDVCHVDGADRFVVGFQRDFSATNSQVRVYLHDDRNTTVNSGRTLTASAPSGRRRQFPQVGGMRGGSSAALLVCEEDPQGSISVGGTLIRSMVIDASGGSVGTPSVVGGTSSTTDRFRPSVTPATCIANPQLLSPYDWVIAWGERSSSYGILLAYVDWRGIPGPAAMAHSSSDPLAEPKVAGSWHWPENEGRFVVCWLRRQSGLVSGSVETRRFDMRAGQAPTWLWLRTVVSVSGARLNSLDIAHDWQTRSHWAVTYSRDVLTGGATAHVVRLGGTGGVVESQSLHASASDEPGELAVAFSEPGAGQTQRFMVSYGLENVTHGVYGREFVYPSDAQNVSYGTACNGAWMTAVGLPFAGNSLFALAAGSQFGEQVVFALGVVPIDLPLPIAGCRLLVNPVVTVTAITFNQLLVLPLPLPDVPAVRGDLYAQILVLLGPQPRASAGLRIQIR